MKEQLGRVSTALAPGTNPVGVTVGDKLPHAFQRIRPLKPGAFASTHIALT
jgi:hypothetical protein